MSDVNDSYNKDFIENADILFMSDEGVLGHENEFLKELASSCKADVIVMGRGKKGLTYFDRKNGLIKDLHAYETKNVVNTVGAGHSCVLQWPKMCILLVNYSIISGESTK